MIPSLVLPNAANAIDHEMKFHSQNASFTRSFFFFLAAITGLGLKGKIIHPMFHLKADSSMINNKYLPIESSTRGSTHDRAF